MCPVHQGMFSTSGDIMSTMGWYNEYIGRCLLNRRNTIMHVGDIMSTSGIISESEEYHYACGEISCHEYIRGCSGYRGCQYKSNAFMNLLPHDIPPMYSRYPSDVLTSPDVLKISFKCTQDILPMYSRYPSNVLKISFKCTQDILQMYSRYPSNVLKISFKCTQDILPMYSRYPSNVLKISFQCTQDILPMYSRYPSNVLKISFKCTQDILQMYSRYPSNVLMLSPDLLNTHHTWWK